MAPASEVADRERAVGERFGQVVRRAGFKTPSTTLFRTSKNRFLTGE